MDIPAMVEASPRCVAAHDRIGWLSLFSEDAVVEDPVGATRYSASDLPGFYDTFIAANDIAFEVERDAGSEHDLWRDVTIVTRLSTGVALRVPAFVRYRLNADGRIEELCAYWQLRRMVWQVLGAGARGLWTMTLLSVRMLRHLGVRALWGFARALFCGRVDDAAVRAVLGDAIGIDKLISAGQSTVCRFSAPSGRCGVAWVRFAPHSRAVEETRLYLTARTE